MKIRHLYLCVGACAAVAAVIVLAGQNIRYANAQLSAAPGQAEQADSANQDDAVQPEQQIELQSQSQTGTQARATDPNKRAWRASEIIGMNVRGRGSDDAIGEISDAMIRSDGKISYVAVSFGGFLGLGEKLFAVPWEAVEFVREGADKDDVYARIDVTEQQLRTKRGFDNDRWPTQADESFLQDGSRPPRQVERPVAPTQDQNVPR